MCTNGPGCTFAHGKPSTPSDSDEMPEIVYSEEEPDSDSDCEDRTPTISFPTTLVHPCEQIHKSIIELLPRKHAKSQQLVT